MENIAQDFNKGSADWTNSPDAVVVVDYSFKYLFVNPVAERIYKRSSAELIGKHPSDVFPKEWEFGPFKTIQKNVYERKGFEMNYHSPFANQWIQIIGTPFEHYFTFFYKAVHLKTILDNELRREVKKKVQHIRPQSDSQHP